MITRKSALAIAQAYQSHFTYTYGEKYKFYVDSLHDLLYVNEFDAWFLNLVTSIKGYDHRGLLEFIMRLHTGESISTSTPNFTWQQRQTLGQRLLKDLAETLIRAQYTEGASHRGKTDNEALDQMIKALEIDGYVYRNDVLWVPEETVIEEGEEQGILEGLMLSLGFSDISVIKHFLNLSATDYQESHWENSIANSRKVLEGVLAQSASRYCSSSNKPLSNDALNKPFEVRNYLESVGILDKKEKDTIAQTYGLLSETGGHPYIAERDQARLMRHLSLTFSQFVLLRLQGALKQLSKS